MFENLKSKLRNRIFTFISILLLFYTVFSYFVSTSVIRKDFNQKTEEINQRVLYSISNKLKSVEDSVVLFDKKNNARLISQDYDTSMIRSFSEMISVHSDMISGVFSFTANREYYTNSEYVPYFEAFVNETRKLNFENISTNRWEIFNDKIIYFYRICNDDEKIIGIIGLDVDKNFIYEIIEKEDNIFTENSRFVFECNGKTVSVDTDKEVDTLGAVCADYRHDNMMIRICYSNSYMIKILILMAVLLILLYAVSCWIFWRILSSYTENTILNLKILQNKMDSFNPEHNSADNLVDTSSLKGRFFTKIPMRNFYICTIFVVVFVSSLSCALCTCSLMNYNVKNKYNVDYVDCMYNELTGNISSVITTIETINLSVLNYKEIDEAVSNPLLEHSEKQEIIGTIFSMLVPENSAIDGVKFVGNDGEIYNYDVKKGIGENTDIYVTEEYLSRLSNSGQTFYEKAIEYDGEYYCIIGGNLYGYSYMKQWGSIIYLVKSNEIGAFNSLSGTGEHTFFITCDDVIISHHDKMYLNYKPYIMENSIKSEAYSVESRLCDTNRISNKIYIYRITSTESFEKILTDIVRWNMFIFILVCMIAIFLSFFYSRKVSRGMNMLDKQISEFVTNFEGPIPEIYNNELLNLSNSYNILVQEIKKYIDELKLRDENQRLLEIKTLQSQINPHFIYNALDVISWKAKENHQEDIDDMIISLASYLRIGLHKGDMFVSIADEIRHVASYVAIEKSRYNNLFDIDIDVDESIIDYSVIKIILQPIVENSIRHGFKRIEHKGIIRVKIEKDEEYIYFEVEDNGNGFVYEDRTKLPQSESKTGGVGLYNVNQRLIMQYGTESALQINSEVDVGTRVNFKIKIEK